MVIISLHTVSSETILTNCVRIGTIALVSDLVSRQLSLHYAMSYYRLQTKFTKVIVLHVSVCPQGWGSPGPGPRVGVCIPACTEADTPSKQTAAAADGTHPTGTHSC